MLLSFLLLSATLVIAVPSASPPEGIAIPLHKRSSIKRADGTVNVAALRAQLSRAISKLDRGFAAIEKNTGSPHPLANGVKKSLAKHQTRKRQVAEPTEDEEDDLWQGTITVGNPPQSFVVDFDTGSSDTFLPATDCDDSCAGHTLWDTDADTTAVNTTTPYFLQFGSGNCTGFIFNDSLTIAGITATGQAIGASNHYSVEFETVNFPSDGIAGMGFPALSVFGDDPFFTTLVNQGAVPTSTFGMKLAETGSELFLGGVNTALFTGDFVEVPIVEDAFYEVALEGFSLNDEVLAQGSVAAIVDSGTTLLIGDSVDVEFLYSNIRGARDATNTVGAGFFTLPCTNIPTVGMILNDEILNISPEIFNLGVLEGNTCVGGIVADDVGFWVLGDIFMRNFYTAFNQGNSTVGFAELA